MVAALALFFLPFSFLGVGGFLALAASQKIRHTQVNLKSPRIEHNKMKRPEKEGGLNADSWLGTCLSWSSGGGFGSSRLGLRSLKTNNTGLKVARFSPGIN